MRIRAKSIKTLCIRASNGIEYNFMANKISLFSFSKESTFNEILKQCQTLEIKGIMQIIEPKPKVEKVAISSDEPKSTKRSKK